VPQLSTAQRVWQFLHPGVGASLNVAGGYYSRNPPVVALDDPQGSGIDLQRLEITLTGGLGRYLDVAIALAVPHLSGLIVDEAFARSMRMKGFQLKAGVFRARFGSENLDHLDQTDFVRRPQSYMTFVGLNGLRGPGVEASFLIPRLPFDLEISAAALQQSVAPPDQILQSFGGGDPWELTYVGSLRGSGRVRERYALSLGFAYAAGKSSQRVTQSTMIPGTMAAVQSLAFTQFDNFYTHNLAIDFALGWRSQRHRHLGVTWQTDYYFRAIPNAVVDGNRQRQTEGGFFTQLVVQAAHDWLTGLRVEMVGLPQFANVKRELAFAGMITWRPTIWTQLRLHGEVRYPFRAGEPVNGAIFLQLQGSLAIFGADR
jgi:hypothetical protein